MFGFDALDDLTLEEKLWLGLENGLAAAAGYHEDRDTQLALVPRTPDLTLREFAKEAWPVLEPAAPLVWGWHLEALLDHLEGVSRGDITRLLVNVPPGTTKSLSVCVLWPAWEWTYMPWVRSLFYSFNGNFAVRDALRTRRLITSDWYQRHWGHVFRLTTDQNQKTRYENNRTGFRMSSGIGGSVTGERGHRVVIDDPMKASDARNDNKLASVNTIFDEAISSRLSEPSKSAIVIVMQRLNANDLSGHVMKTNPRRWAKLSIPMEYEPIPAEQEIPVELDNRTVTPLPYRDPRRERGQLLDPDRFPDEVVQDMKRVLGGFGYAAQCQQRPVPAGGGMFQKSWFRFYQPEGTFLSNEVTVMMDDGTQHRAPVITAPNTFEETIQSWDLTFDSSEAMVVGNVWARSRGNAFLLAEERGAWEYPEQIRAIRRLTEAWPFAAAKLIEMAANAKASAATLRSTIPGIILVPASEDKVTRASVVSPFVESGHVYLPHPDMAPWIWDWLYEVATFPMTGFKDRVDVMSQALRRLFLPRGNGRRVPLTNSYNSLMM
jgi:predicted phage terminase large subunit-like protein